YRDWSSDVCSSDLNSVSAASRDSFAFTAAPRSKFRRSVPLVAYKQRYHIPSAVMRLRSHVRQKGEVVEAMMPKTVPSGSRNREAGAELVSAAALTLP